MTLARTEFKLRYFGSVLGYVWSLMRPLLFFGVLYLFFTQIVDIGKGSRTTGSTCSTGIVLWNFLAEATGDCVACLSSARRCCARSASRGWSIPLSVSLTATFNLA